MKKTIKEIIATLKAHGTKEQPQPTEEEGFDPCCERGIPLSQHLADLSSSAISELQAENEELKSQLQSKNALGC